MFKQYFHLYLEIPLTWPYYPFITVYKEHIISHTPNVEQWYLSGEVQPCVSSLANQYKKYLDGCGGETSYLTAITDITLGKRIISICVRLISGTLALKKSKKNILAYDLEIKIYNGEIYCIISRDIGSYIGKN